MAFKYQKIKRMEVPQLNRYNQIMKGLVFVGDLLIVNLLFFLFYLLANSMGRHPELKATLPQALLIISLCYSAFLLANGIIVHKRGIRPHQVLGLVFCNVFFFSVLAGIVLEIGNFARVVSLFYVAYVTVLFIVLAIFRFAVYKMIKDFRRQGKNLRHIILVGGGENNQRLYHELTYDDGLGYRVYGYFDQGKREEFPTSCPYLGKLDEVEGYLQEHKFIDSLYCGLSSEEYHSIPTLIDYCENHLVHFFGVPNIPDYFHHRMFISLMGQIPVLSLRDDPMSRFENRVLKRTFDIVFSGLFLCTLFPFIYIFVAIGIKLTMPGPVFFRQKRSGYNGKEFTCLKFRSMRVNAEADKVQATKDDPRKTRFGNFLRHSSLDEMPQFINVFRGDMSVVGPRPHMLMHTEEYSQLIDKYMVRHFVKPGITGWSQVTGFRGETKELSQMQGRVRGDIWYIEHWTFWLDIMIIYKTIANAVKGDKEAY